ncbi:MAG: hypothetical protein GF353_03745 [Candidatus Lokiarchaeota archaeon]|nr:hypothetical protein [Candidatus Lokiarchaeota archaeon]
MQFCLFSSRNHRNDLDCVCSCGIIKMTTKIKMKKYLSVRSRKKLYLVKRIFGGIVSVIGFILSPLTWWNDLVVNLPLAFGFAYIIGKICSGFMPVGLAFFFILMTIGYFLTNFVGFIMMEKGAIDVYRPNKKSYFSIKRSLIYSCIAIILVLASIQLGMLDMSLTNEFFASVLHKVSFLK